MSGNLSYTSRTYILHLIDIYKAYKEYCYILTFDPAQMPFKVMHRKEVTHSDGSYERKSHGQKLADEMGQGKAHDTLID